MNFLDEVPAVRRIETDRDDLFAFEIAGHVTAADAENLYGLLEAAYALHPGSDERPTLDVLVRLTDHEGVDWKDIPSETIEQGKARALAHIRRCAAIGEPDWTTHFKGLFATPVSVELRHFTSADEPSAWHWLAARPIETRT